MLPSHPRLAWPFSVVVRPGEVLLVFGDEFRFSIEGDGVHEWLPGWLNAFDGRAVPALLDAAGMYRDDAQTILSELVSEALVVETPLVETPLVGAPLADRSDLGAGLPEVAVLAQDCWDVAALRQRNRQHLAEKTAWIWWTSAPVRRVIISPVFRPPDGPCAECVLSGFVRTSTAPEVWAALLDTASQSDATRWESAPLPDGVRQIAEGLVAAKLAPPIRSTTYRLHVIEVDSLAVTTHVVLRDPECAACRGR